MPELRRKLCLSRKYDNFGNEKGAPIVAEARMAGKEGSSMGHNNRDLILGYRSNALKTPSGSLAITRRYARVV